MRWKFEVFNGYWKAHEEMNHRKNRSSLTTKRAGRKRAVCINCHLKWKGTQRKIHTEPKLYFTKPNQAELFAIKLYFQSIKHLKASKHMFNSIHIQQKCILCVFWLARTDCAFVYVHISLRRRKLCLALNKSRKRDSFSRKRKWM